MQNMGIHPAQDDSPLQGTQTIHSQTHTKVQFRISSQPD